MDVFFTSVYYNVKLYQNYIVLINVITKLVYSNIICYYLLILKSHKYKTALFYTLLFLCFGNTCLLIYNNLRPFLIQDSVTLQTLDDTSEQWTFNDFIRTRSERPEGL
jgi:hypothetical protein